MKPTREEVEAAYVWLQTEWDFDIKTPVLKHVEVIHAAYIELEKGCTLLEKELHRIEKERIKEQHKLMDLEAENAALREQNKLTANEIYEHIKHGDEKHRAWLREKLDEVFCKIGAMREGSDE